MTDHDWMAVILALDECVETEEEYEIWRATYARFVPSWEHAEHWGDCTKQSHTCLRCLYEDARRRLPVFRHVVRSVGGGA